MRKTVLIILSVLLIGIGAILASPYKQHGVDRYPSVKTSIVINTPPDAIFNYLGNSGNASNWSVYVDHIITLNADEVKDGMPGSIRRCFKQADEKGIIWDELITEVIPNQKRQLNIFNMQGFPVVADGLASQQIYEPIDSGHTRLTFTLLYLKEQSVTQTIKTKMGAYIVRNIFKKNLRNIKQRVEQL